MKKLSLIQLSNSQLVSRELKTLKGGYCAGCDEGCFCPCYNQPSEEKTSSYNMDYCSTDTEEHLDLKDSGGYSEGDCDCYDN